MLGALIGAYKCLCSLRQPHFNVSCNGGALNIPRRVTRGEDRDPQGSVLPCGGEGTSAMIKYLHAPPLLATGLHPSALYGQGVDARERGHRALPLAANRLMLMYTA